MVPPVNTLPDDGTTGLYARPERVIESKRITTSRPSSTRRLAFVPFADAEPASLELAFA